MIHLLPDKTTNEHYNTIDFDILEQVCTLYFSSICNNRRSYKIYIKTIEGDIAQFDATGKTINIKIIKDLKDERTYLKFFLHEFRHFLQHKALHIPFNNSTYDDSTHKRYINSPLEVDVKVFLKKHKTPFIKMYYALKKHKQFLVDSEAATKFNGNK